MGLNGAVGDCTGFVSAEYKGGGESYNFVCRWFNSGFEPMHQFGDPGLC